MKVVYKTIILYPVLLLIASRANAQTCNDSGFRKIFFIPGDTIRAINLINTADGGSLLSGFYRINGASVKEGSAFRLDPDGHPLWAKKFSPLPAADLYFTRSLVLTNGHVILAGKQKNPLNSAEEFLVVACLSASGNIIWTNGFQLSPVLGVTGGFEITSLAEGQTGELVVAGAITMNSTNASRSFLAKINSAGSLLFSKYFEIPLGASDAITSVFVKNDYIVVFGSSEDMECIDLDTRSIYAAKFRYSDGQLEHVNRNCFVPTASPISYGWLPHSISAFETDSGYMLAGDLLENGTGRDILIVKFDSGLNFLGTFAVKNFNSNSFHYVNISRSGKIDIMHRESASQRLYFSRLNADGSKRRQRKLQLPSVTFYNHLFDGGQRIAFKPGGAAFISNYTDPGGRNLIEFSKLMDADSNNAFCLGIDTSFSAIQPFGVYASNTQWDQIIDNALIATPVSIVGTDLFLQEENVCKQVIRCDSISITGPDTVCVVGQTTQLIASKNLSCPSPVIWNVTPGIYHTLNQVNDSTLEVVFKTPQYGVVQETIYASIGGCATAIDSIKIQLLSIPRQLPPDTSICAGDSIGITIGSWFKSYTWQDGSTDSVLVAKQAGKYWVRIQAYCGYQFSDTINIAVDELPKNFVPEDTAVCQNSSILLQPNRSFVSYLWSDGSVQPQLTISRGGRYSLQVTDENGCKNRAEILVRQKHCAEYIQFPNAFTPDGSGYNDVFRPLKTVELVDYQLFIYNRWGQRVFATKDPLKGWDGKFAGIMQESNVFAWVCQYRISGQELKTLKGAVLLIRR